MEKLQEFRFAFLQRDPETNPFIPSLIPQEVWKAQVLPHLEKEQLRALRSSCRGFLSLVSQFWGLSGLFERLNEIFPCKIPGWPTEIHLIYFTYSESVHDLSLLSELRSLKKIIFSEYRKGMNQAGFVRDKDLNCLPSGLESLSLFRCDSISAEGLQHLPPNLIELDLEGCLQMRDSWLKHLPPTLQKLCLSNCDHITAEGMKHMPSSLQSLELWNCSQIGDASIQHIPTRVKNLSLGCCTLLTDLGIRYLPSNLEDLSLSYCSKLTDAGMKYLPRSLRKLEISSCGITDEGIQFLPKQILRLDISNMPQLSSSCLPFIPRGLIWLDICGCRNFVAEDLIKYLPLSLKKIIISFTQLYPQEKVKIKQARTKLKIHISW